MSNLLQACRFAEQDCCNFAANKNCYLGTYEYQSNKPMILVYSYSNMIDGSNETKLYKNSSIAAVNSHGHKAFSMVKRREGPRLQKILLPTALFSFLNKRRKEVKVS
ncbi:hypothetical protein AVEN_163381-1 [Araneus ventricosus]|uniref:Uncharacterized protein n=1 Tax=Araneus ventricosus TaxID=182803 RepID=A0A4Y2PYE6_ARAVE|nr:hypothetical protein AVEN_163381-1 [Araneus ventricosus]